MTMGIHLGGVTLKGVVQVPQPAGEDGRAKEVSS